MSTRIASDGSRYVPRRTASGSPEATLKKIRNRAREALRSRVPSDREKNLIRSALARLDEIRIAIGKALASGDPAGAAWLEEQRCEMMSLLSLVLTQIEGKAIGSTSRLMAGKPRSRWSGRSFTADVVVYDEAMILSEDPF